MGKHVPDVLFAKKAVHYSIVEIPLGHLRLVGSRTKTEGMVHVYVVPRRSRGSITNHTNTYCTRDIPRQKYACYLASQDTLLDNQELPSLLPRTLR